VLLLGWIGAAFLGGALPWRPAGYLTGEAATGKSTLQALIKGLLGDSLVQAVDNSDLSREP
jgi:phage/plasmid-associated DNA primase